MRRARKTRLRSIFTNFCQSELPTFKLTFERIGDVLHDGPFIAISSARNILDSSEYLHELLLTPVMSLGSPGPVPTPVPGLARKHLTPDRPPGKSPRTGPGDPGDITGVKCSSYRPGACAEHVVWSGQNVSLRE